MNMNICVDRYDEVEVSTNLLVHCGFGIQRTQKEDICDEGTFLFFRVIGPMDSYIKFGLQDPPPLPSRMYLPDEVEIVYSLAVILVVPPHINSIIVEQYVHEESQADPPKPRRFNIDGSHHYQKYVILVQVQELNSYVRLDWGRCNGEHNTMLLRYTEYDSVRQYFALR